MFKAAILGAPGAGKGTISSRIVKNFDIVHVASGDMLRHHIKKNSDIGKEANKYITRGRLVPDEIMFDLVMSELDNLKTKNWLLDGFPRTKFQAEKLFEKYPLDLAVNLVVPFNIIIDRIKDRWIHVPSGRVYNLNFEPPKVPGKDDVTGEALEQRPDDKPEAVKERLESYSKSIEPVLQFYRKSKILREFHGETSNEIWPNVREELAKYLKPKM